MVIPDTAQKRANYEEQVIRTFYVSHADATELSQMINTIIRISRQMVIPFTLSTDGCVLFNFISHIKQTLCTSNCLPVWLSLCNYCRRWILVICAYSSVYIYINVILFDYA